MTDFKFHWAYRYSDTHEPAIVMVADRGLGGFPMRNIASHAPELRRKLEWICTSNNTTIYRVMLDDSELNLWFSFDLCPFVEALLDDDEDKICMFRTQVVAS